MLKVALVLPLLLASLIGASKAPVFARQQFCGQGLEYCGRFCIPNSYTCCPAEEVGCRPGTSCGGLGTNGLPICCEDDSTAEECRGPGGINLLPGGTITSYFSSISTTFGGPTFAITTDVTSILTLTSTSTLIDTNPLPSTTTSTLTSSLTSVSVETSTSVSSPPVLPSTHASTRSSNVTTGSSTTPTSPPESTGGVESRVHGAAGWMLAMALPIFAL